MSRRWKERVGGCGVVILSGKGWVSRATILGVGVERER